MAMKAKAKVRLQFPDRILIYEFLATVRLNGEGEDADLFAYIDGWNDEKVAEKFKETIPAVLVSHVANIRRSMYGNLIGPREMKSPEGDVEARLSALEERFDKLERRLGGPKSGTSARNGVTAHA